MSEQNSETAGITPAADGPVLHRIAGKVLGQPLLVHPCMGEVVGMVLGGRLPGGGGGELSPEASRFLGSYRRERRDMGLSKMAGGTAIITIAGSLVNRGSWIGASSGLVSYEGLAAQVADAAADPEVHSIVFDIDSPGGEALGVFGLAEQIRAVDKPTVAYVNDMAASAGYAIAAACDEIVVSQSSVVGSIGVVMMRADSTGKLEQDGIKVEVFTAGAFKADGHPFTEMSEQEKKRTQGLIDRFYSLFVSSVAAGRGDRLTEDQARETEAGVYIGQDAITAGLADRIAPLSAVLKDLQPALGANHRHREGITMTDNINAPQAGATSDNAPSADAIADFRAQGAQAERDRIGAILTCDAAEGREAQARTIALETDMGVEQAAKILEASPKAEQVSTIEARSREEAELGGAGAQPEGRAEAEASIWKDAVADANMSIGVKA